MKSLRRSTPEVRTSKSRGGASTVIMFSVKVWALMDSGSKNVTSPCASSFSEGLMAVDVEEDSSSSPVFASFDPGDADRDSGCSGLAPVLSSSICFRRCCVISDSENVRFEGVGRLWMGVLYVSTVFMTAVVISSREVYGKQTLRTAL